MVNNVTFKGKKLEVYGVTLIMNFFPCFSMNFAVVILRRMCKKSFQAHTRVDDIAVTKEFIEVN